MNNINLTTKCPAVIFGNFVHYTGQSAIITWHKIVCKAKRLSNSLQISSCLFDSMLVVLNLLYWLILVLSFRTASVRSERHVTNWSTPVRVTEPRENAPAQPAELSGPQAKG